MVVRRPFIGGTTKLPPSGEEVFGGKTSCTISRERERKRKEGLLNKSEDIRNTKHGIYRSKKSNDRDDFYRPAN